MSEERLPIWSDAVVGVLGVIAFFAGVYDNAHLHGASRGDVAAFMRMLVAYAVPYVFLGMLTGAIWPGKVLRWTVVLLAPLAIVLVFALVLSNRTQPFFTNDLPLFSMLFIASMGGVWLGGAIRGRIGSKRGS